MPKRGIHPIMRTMTVVLSNGASLQIPTVLKRKTPFMLQVDPTSHPLWTGEKQGLSVQDARLQMLVSRYDRFTKGEASS